MIVILLIAVDMVFVVTEDAIAIAIVAAAALSLTSLRSNFFPILLRLLPLLLLLLLLLLRFLHFLNHFCGSGFVFIFHFLFRRLRKP